MPLSRQTARAKASPTSASSQKPFSFPNTAHLLITTSGHIYSWDATGIHTVFRSSNNGILAAREAQDGSGILAVADRNVVVLHDTKRGQERSWGLKADADEVRHLEYTADAKSLFLSTNLTSDIQRYSAEQSRLLSPRKAHATPPVALAVSPKGHLMVSASSDPPTVYLSNLSHNSAPVLIESIASEAAVTCISFHPERPDIFLLAFADGVVSAYDSTRIARKTTGSLANQEGVNRGEIGRLNDLHRPILQEGRTHCVEAAAFLPGHRTRAVTVGRDGKCRIVDFADGGVILRTWHAKAPVTSVSIFSRIQPSSKKPAIGSTRPARNTVNSAGADHLIAISRVDGVIQMYDPVGLLLEQKALRAHAKIISVEWVTGKSPRPITNSVVAREADLLPIVDSSKADRADNSSEVLENKQKRRSTQFEHVGLPPALRKPKPEPAHPRQFAVHPDEVVEDTVRHTPMPAGAKYPPVVQEEYLDLFSPVKIQEPNANSHGQKPLPSPPRTRPKVSSQTFVKSPLTDTNSTDPTVADPRNNDHSPLKDPRSQIESGHSQPTTGKRRISGKHAAVRLKPPRRSTNLATEPRIVTNDNARILADLRRLGARHPAQKPPAASAVASFHQPNGKWTQDKRSMFHRPRDVVDTDLASEEALLAYEDAHDKQTWPDDSHQGSSLEDGDIWLTSEDEHIAEGGRSRRQRIPPTRSPARQTSRSRMDSKGTISTLRRPAFLPPAQVGMRPIVLDGSTEEEMFTAHETCIDSNGMLLPSSRDIQELFPRSSSLSPRKHGRRRSKRPEVSPSRDPRVLREITSNAPTSRQAKSPWKRAQASKEKAAAIERGVPNGAHEHQDEPERRDNAAAETCCSSCDVARDRMHDLEGQVGRLKGEVLVLKAVLRRQGLPMPPSLQR